MKTKSAERSDYGKDRLALIRKVEKEVNYKRFIHTLGVATTAVALAARFGEDVQKADTAGILHDCAKCIDVDKMEKVIRKAGMEIRPVEQKSSALLHAKAGSVLARTEYGIEDEEILSAIRWHTTGKPAMNGLEKIIFIADYIEPGRTTPGVEPIREAAFRDLDEALCMILEQTLSYLESKDADIDELTQETYDYYVNETETEDDD